MNFNLDFKSSFKATLISNNSFCAFSNQGWFQGNLNFSQINNIDNVSLMNFDEVVNIITLNNSLVIRVLIVCVKISCLCYIGHDYTWISQHHLWNSKSLHMQACFMVLFDRISINVVSSYEEVMVCLYLFFCHKSVYVNEKIMTVWV